MYRGFCFGGFANRKKQCRRRKGRAFCNWQCAEHYQIPTLCNSSISSETLIIQFLSVSLCLSLSSSSQIPAPMKRIPTAESPATDFPLPPQHLRPPSSIQRKKKTRELPNLSNCHCCNRRINTTNPKNRLRTLTSEWRIVLLCNSCYGRVESSQSCSYCLTNIPSCSSADSFLDCKRCQRRIHRKCVSMFSWSKGNGGDFSVCFDCWVPKMRENDYIRVCESRPWKKVKKEAKICGDSTSLDSSRVCNAEDKDKYVEEMVNVANAVAQKKIAVANKAKEKVSAKPVVARRAVELAVEGRDVVSLDNGGGNRGDSVVDDDTQLAFQLHRAMNSSPRISRNSRFLSTSCFNVSKVNVNANSKALLSQAADKTHLSKLVNAGSDDSTIEIDSSSQGDQSALCSVDMGQDLVQKAGETEDQNGKLASDSNDCLITYRRKRQASQDERAKEETDGLLKMYRRRLSHVERRNLERDHCFKTYHRRFLSFVTL